MPVEYEQLRGKPCHVVPVCPNCGETVCPSCGATPFRHFARGTVQKTGWRLLAERYRAWERKRPVRYCAVICSDCHEVVGWESPLDYERSVSMKKYEFLAAGQTMTVGEVRAALEGRGEGERVNVFVVIADEAVALEDLVKVTHHQSIFEDEEHEKYRSVCLHISNENLMRLLREVMDAKAERNPRT